MISKQLSKSKIRPLTHYISVVIVVVAVILAHWVSYPREGVVAGLMMFVFLFGAITLSNLFFLIPLKTKLVQLILATIFVLLVVFSIPILKAANSVDITISGLTLVMFGWGIVIYLLRIGFKNFTEK